MSQKEFIQIMMGNQSVIVSISSVAMVQCLDN